MPNENIQDWSTTALSNGNSDGAISLVENSTTRASMNNNCRSIMAAIAKLRNYQNGSITTGGTSSAFTFSSGLSFTGAPPTGMVVLLKAHAAPAANATLNMDGIGAATIKDLYGDNLDANMWAANARLWFNFDGTNWVCLTPLKKVSAFSAHKNGTNQTGVVSGAETQLTWSTEAYDLAGDFAADAWTPPVGKVSIKAGFQATGTITASTQVSITVKKNNVSLKTALFPAGSNVASAYVALDDDHSVVTDPYNVYVTLFTTAGTATITGTATATYFMGHMIN